MSTITIADVRYAFERLCKVYDYHDLLNPGEFLTLEEGSKTYGRAYRVYLRRPDRDGFCEPRLHHNYLGMAKAEAYQTLHSLAIAIDTTATIVAERYSKS